MWPAVGPEEEANEEQRLASEGVGTTQKTEATPLPFMTLAAVTIGDGGRPGAAGSRREPLAMTPAAMAAPHPRRPHQMQKKRGGGAEAADPDPPMTSSGSGAALLSGIFIGGKGSSDGGIVGKYGYASGARPGIPGLGQVRPDLGGHGGTHSAVSDMTGDGSAQHAAFGVAAMAETAVHWHPAGAGVGPVGVLLSDPKAYAEPISEDYPEGVIIGGGEIGSTWQL